MQVAVPPNNKKDSQLKAAAWLSEKGSPVDAATGGVYLQRKYRENVRYPHHPTLVPETYRYYPGDAFYRGILRNPRPTLLREICGSYPGDALPRILQFPTPPIIVVVINATGTREGRRDGFPPVRLDRPSFRPQRSEPRTVKGGPDDSEGGEGNRRRPRGGFRDRPGEAGAVLQGGTDGRTEGEQC